MNNYSPNAEITLILSPDSLTGALVGAAVELIGVGVAFPRPEASLRDELRRVRPAFVLIDCQHTLATRADFLGPAMMTGVRLILFGAESRLVECEALVRRYRLGVIAIPRDLTRLNEILAQAPPSAPALLR